MVELSVPSAHQPFTYSSQWWGYVGSLSTMLLGHMSCSAHLSFLDMDAMDVCSCEEPVCGYGPCALELYIANRLVVWPVGCTPYMVRIHRAGWLAPQQCKYTYTY